MLSRRAACALFGGTLAGLVSASADGSARQVTPEGTPGNTSLPRPLDVSPFLEQLESLTPERIAELEGIVLEATVSDLSAAIDSGLLSSVELCTFYLHRIMAYDIDGLRSVIELNPDLLEIAAARDAGRATGNIAGPLHGIPVLIKDNITTGDKMHTTAGAAVLREARPARGAFLIDLLRASGAILFGKANMSEWAYWMAYAIPSGYSSVGGQVVSPYDPAIDPLGSSTGSAVAVSANLVTLAIGTETAGSIIAPASVNGVVGMHPSLGLVSRNLIVPITSEMDGAGPMARTVRDAAALLTVIASRSDVDDRFAADAVSLVGTDFTATLDAGALSGSRLGVIGAAGMDLEMFAGIVGIGDVLEILTRGGAEPVYLTPAPFAVDLETAVNGVMKHDVAAYLEATQAPVASMADVVAYNLTDLRTFAPYGQERLQDVANSQMSEAEARALSKQHRDAARAWLDDLIEANALDAVLSLNNGLSLQYALAGYPAVTVPAGLTQGEPRIPFGLTFTGPYLSDARVLSLAYAFEQLANLRVPPEIGDATRPND